MKAKILQKLKQAIVYMGRSESISAVEIDPLFAEGRIQSMAGCTLAFRGC